MSDSYVSAYTICTVGTVHCADYKYPGYVSPGMLYSKWTCEYCKGFNDVKNNRCEHCFAPRKR